MDSIKNLFPSIENNSDKSGDSKKLPLSEAEIDKIADWLEYELRGGERSRGFYCKSAKYFPRGYLTSVVSRAQREGRDKNRLFVFLIRKEMDKRGII